MSGMHRLKPDSSRLRSAALSATKMGFWKEGKGNYYYNGES